jgi:hypothetical protein
VASPINYSNSWEPSHIEPPLSGPGGSIFTAVREPDSESYHDKISALHVLYTLRDAGFFTKPCTQSGLLMWLLGDLTGGISM